MDSTIPTNMKTLDCIFGLSLIAANPAAPTNPKPIPEPAAARPNAIPAPINLVILNLTFPLFRLGQMPNCYTRIVC